MSRLLRQKNSKTPDMFNSHIPFDRQLSVQPLGGDTDNIVIKAISNIYLEYLL